MLDQGFEPLRILAGLRSHGVSFVLVGGLGAAVRGGPVETDDVDIVLPNDPQNLPRLALSLQQLGAQLDAPTSATDDRVSYDTSYGRLDCMELPLGVRLRSNANAAEMDVGNGVTARVASLEDLARLEADVARPRGCGATARARRRGVADVRGSRVPAGAQGSHGAVARGARAAVDA